MRSDPIRSKMATPFFGPVKRLTSTIVQLVASWAYNSHVVCCRYAPDFRSVGCCFIHRKYQQQCTPYESCRVHGAFVTAVARQDTFHIRDKRTYRSREALDLELEVLIAAGPDIR